MCGPLSDRETEAAEIDSVGRAGSALIPLQSRSMTNESKLYDTNTEGKSTLFDNESETIKVDDRIGREVSLDVHVSRNVETEKFALNPRKEAHFANDNQCHLLMEKKNLDIRNQLVESKSPKTKKIDKIIVRRDKIRWSPNKKLKLTPSKIGIGKKLLIEKGSKKDKISTPVKTNVVKEIKTSKVKLMVEAFEKNINMEGASRKRSDVVDLSSIAGKMNAFQVLMDNSRRFGETTPSPRRKNPRKKTIGKLHNLQKF